MAYVDSWPTASTSSSLPSPALTPTKRASRHNRISNDVDHPSFSRTRTGPDSDLTIEYRIGDAVVVSDEVKLKQKFLHPPPYLVSSSAKKGKGKGKGRGKKRAADGDEGDEGYTGWKHQDGLKAGDKVAVVTRLFEDVRGRKMALVRWFARPGAVWGEDGPDEDELGGPVLPYELYYTADSTHLFESRALRERAAANPFLSSPSKLVSPSKHSVSSSFISSAAASKTPLHSDPIPLSTIVSHAEILSPSDLEDASTAITPAMQKALPTFVVRKVYDVKPVVGADFWAELDEEKEGGWERLRKRGIEGWRNAEGDARVEGWEVEPVMEDDGESEAELDKEKERQRRKEKARPRSEKGKAKAMERRADEGDATSSDDDEDNAEDAFAPGAASDASSLEDEDGVSSDEEVSGSEDSDDEHVPRTPTKSRKRNQQLPTPSSSRTGRKARSSTSSPTKRTRPSVTTTTVRAAKRRRFTAKSAEASASAHNPLPPLLSAAYLASLPSALERAKALLHVSATPESLPCREEQRERIRQFVGDAVLGRTGGCLYVHGVPGTGKTATVHSVVRELQNDPDMDPFTFVEINGMKISEPTAAFSHLWAALSAGNEGGSKAKAKTSPKAALAALEGWFANPDPARKTTVVLVDELDQMLTKRQDVLYNFFNWPHCAHSRLVVIAVANTMDLPERELSGKIRSRLGTNRIPFQPYTWTELKRILEARLALVHPSSSSSLSSRTPTSTPLFDDVALQKIAKSVAGISGDARKALDVARRTLDRVALRSEDDEGEVRCTIQDAAAAYNEMTKYGPGFFVRRLSLHQKVLLLAVAQCVRRAGVPEVELDTIFQWHFDFLRQTSLVRPAALPSKNDLFALVAQLHAMRLLATESQRFDVLQRVRAGVDEGDVFAALREDEMLRMHVPQGA
ncbi:hypothetical protein JCM21900_006099 [Sporobolomyces salmonicolor]